MKLDAPSNAPRFQDIVDLLSTIVPIPIGRHGNFWKGVSRDEFVIKKVFGKTLVVPGDPNASFLYLALAGRSPFDGSSYSRMPDVDAQPACRYATDLELQVVQSWIVNGAP